MERYVSDEVWRQLDPRAGRLPRRTTLRVWIAATLVAVVAAATGVVWGSGAVVPRLVYPLTAATSASGGPTGPLMRELTVENRGWVALTLLGAGRDAPGLDLAEVAGTFPVTLVPGDRLSFVLVYRLTDCAAVPVGPWPVPVRVERPWGEQTAYVAVPAEPGPAAPDSYSYSGRDPYGVEWQRALADLACRPVR